MSFLGMPVYLRWMPASTGLPSLSTSLLVVLFQSIIWMPHIIIESHSHMYCITMNIWRHLCLNHFELPWTVAYFNLNIDGFPIGKDVFFIVTEFSTINNPFIYTFQCGCPSLSKVAMGNNNCRKEGDWFRALEDVSFIMCIHHLSPVVLDRFPTIKVTIPH